MKDNLNAEEVFIRKISILKSPENILDELILNEIETIFNTTSELGYCGVSIFDLANRKYIYYKDKLASILGYNESDCDENGYFFFADKIHKDDVPILDKAGVKALNYFESLPLETKFDYKFVSEFRMLKANGDYVRISEQYQVLYCNKEGHLRLIIGTVDISPDQDVVSIVKYKLFNYKTGELVKIKINNSSNLKLTSREKDVLLGIKNGLLSKEISHKFSISINTVNTIRQRILKKLGANNAAEAIQIASKNNLLE